MRPLSRDTSPDIHRLVVEHQRRLSPEAKHAAILGATAFLRRLVAKDIASGPTAETAAILMRRCYGSTPAWTARATPRSWDKAMQPDGLDLLFHELARAFEQLGISAFVGGSYASSQRGILRSTQDIDVVADLQESQAAALPGVLGDDFTADVDAITEATRRGQSFNVVYIPAVMKADIFVARDDALATAEFSRLHDSGLPLPIASAEYIILAKLRWYRAGSGVSDQQWKDVLGVIQTQGEALDEPYLEAWAERLGLTELWRQARDDAA